MVRILAVLVFLVPAQAGLAARVALLIGNGDYGTPSLNLRNPVNDANALGTALEALDFRVTRLVNADRAEVEAALDRFRTDAAKAEAALVFFAGHGVQIEGENHLLTSGFSELTLGEVGREAVTLTEIRQAVQAADPDIGLIIVDACRNNPFSATGAAETGLARSQGGAGVLIAYATDPGNVAYDGEAENSLFTQALVDNIAAPGLDVRLMFGRVRQQVVLRSAGRQIPWVEEAVLGEHRLNPGPVGVAVDTALQRDLEAWTGASNLGTAAAYRTYVETNPDGMFRSFAESRLSRLEDGTDDVPVPPGRIERMLSSADRGQLIAALRALGFLHPDAQPGEADLIAALESYARQMAPDGDLRPDTLYREAAWAMAMTGGTTAQRLRTDLAALSSIDQTLAMAEGSMRELERHAETNATARDLVTGARDDIDAIRTSRDRVLERLDGSRDYYVRLLGIAERYFQPELAATLARMETGDTTDRSAETNARIFISHALGGRRGADRSSISWLSDFLPES